MNVTCPQCKKVEFVPDYYKGKRVKCVKCSEEFTPGILAPPKKKPTDPIASPAKEIERESPPSPQMITIQESPPTSPIPSGTGEPVKVIITGVEMSTWQWFVLLFTIGILSIPVMIVITCLVTVTSLLVAAMLAR